MTQVKFGEWNCTLRWSRYQSTGAIAIILDQDPPDPEDDSPVAIATVNLWGDPKLDSDEVAIKTWSENEGMLEVLMAAGVIAAPHRLITTGFCETAICRLKVKPEWDGQTLVHGA